MMMLFFFDSESRRILALDGRRVVFGQDADSVEALGLGDEAGGLDEARLEALGEGLGEILSLFPAGDIN